MQSLSFLSFICMYFLDRFSCSDSTLVSPCFPVCNCSLLIEEEGGCRHVQSVKWPLIYLFTCLNKYISKPVLFEGSAQRLTLCVLVSTCMSCSTFSRRHRYIFIELELQAAANFGLFSKM